MDRWYTAVEGVWDKSFGRIGRALAAVLVRVLPAWLKAPIAATQAAKPAATQAAKKPIPKKPWWRVALETFVFAVFAITIIWNYFFQIVVLKSLDGPALIPGWDNGPHLPALSRVRYNDIIPFVSKSYVSRGPLFELAHNAVLLGSLGMLNIDRKDGKPQVKDLVKRVAVPTNTIAHFDRGDLTLELPGGTRIAEAAYRTLRGLDMPIQRLVTQDAYAMRTQILWYLALQQAGLSTVGSEPQGRALTLDEQRLDPVSAEATKARYHAQLNPADIQRPWVRDLAGIYTPEGMILPLGDNRDNSHDGRRYGPIPTNRVMGEILFRFSPLSRFGGIH